MRVACHGLEYQYHRNAIGKIIPGPFFIFFEYLKLIFFEYLELPSGDFQALRGGDRVLLRLPSVGGGTTKRDRLSLLVGAVYRMVQGCFTPRDLMLSVVEMSVEFVISTCSNSLSLVRMALHRVSKATEKDTNVRVKLLSETLMGLYWMLSGL